MLLATQGLLIAMEPEEPEPMHIEESATPMEVEEFGDLQSPLQQVPSEILTLILTSPVGKNNQERLENAVKTIRSLMSTNKYFYRWVNRNTGYLINELTKYTDGNEAKATAALGTENAIEWLINKKELTLPDISIIWGMNKNKLLIFLEHVLRKQNNKLQIKNIALSIYYLINYLHYPLHEINETLFKPIFLEAIDNENMESIKYLNTFLVFLEPEIQKSNRLYGEYVDFQFRATYETLILDLFSTAIERVLKKDNYIFAQFLINEFQLFAKDTNSYRIDELLEIILEAALDENNNKTIRFIIEQNHPNAIVFVLVNNIRRNDLNVATLKRNNFKRVKTLLENGADKFINYCAVKGSTISPLEAAIENLSVEMVKLLLHFGADTQSAIYCAQHTDAITPEEIGNKKEIIALLKQHAR